MIDSQRPLLAPASRRRGANAMKTDLPNSKPAEIHLLALKITGGKFAYKLRFRLYFHRRQETFCSGIEAFHALS
jgi:hypothetical protein